MSLVPALVTLGRLQARRGESDARATLDWAWRVAEPTGEPQRVAPMAAARAVHAWLEGDSLAAIEAARPAHELAVAHGYAWQRGAGVLAWRAGSATSPQPDDPPAYARSIAEDPRGAAAEWEALGFPYERADALSEAAEHDARHEALTVFERLGAGRAAERLRRRIASLRRSLLDSSMRARPGVNI